MTRLFRMISGVALRHPPTQVAVGDALVKGARRVVPTLGAHDHPGFILVHTGRNAQDALAGDWAAIGGDIEAAYHEAAGETGVFVDTAHAVGAAALAPITARPE